MSIISDTWIYLSCDGCSEIFKLPDGPWLWEPTAPVAVYARNQGWFVADDNTALCPCCLKNQDAAVLAALAGEAGPAPEGNNP